MPLYLALGISSKKLNDNRRICQPIPFQEKGQVVRDPIRTALNTCVDILESIREDSDN